MDQEINFNFKNRECANITEAHQMRIHIESRNVMMSETDTGESLKSKKLIGVVVGYLDILKKFIDEFLPSVKDFEEQWELDINVFKYLKYFEAFFNNQYLTLSGKDLILARHSKASSDNVLKK